MVAKHDHTLTSSGLRPACSAAAFTTCTALAVVSSEKNVWSTTSSKQRPPNANVSGPKATSVRPIGLLSGRSMARTGYARVLSWKLVTTSPLHKRLINPANSSMDLVVMEAMPYASNMGLMPRPKPRLNRPLVRACMVLANVAVTIGCRVV